MTSEYYSDIPIQMLKNKRILEIGSGTGENQLRSRHGHIFKRASEKKMYFGIDIQEFKRTYLNIDVADVLELEVGCDSFDTILFMHCLEHIEIHEWPLLFNNMKCWLKSGGWLIVACPYNELSERPCSPDHVVFNINEATLQGYLPSVRMFKSGIQYPRRGSIRKAIWWFRLFFHGKRYVPLGLTRHSFTAFWRKEREQ